MAPPGVSQQFPGAAEKCPFPETVREVMGRGAPDTDHTFWPTSHAWFVLPVA